MYRMINASLTLNKEIEVNDNANVLDLNVSICDGKLRVKVYDKRDDFPFQIVQFSKKIEFIPQLCFRSVSITDCEIF